MKMFARGIFPVAILLAFAFLLPSCTKKIQQSSLVAIIDTSIQSVNWDSLLAHDTIHFEYDSLNTDTLYQLGPRYELVQGSDQGGYFKNSFYPTKYIDLNRDGREDAIVLVSNPGSGAFVTAIIFLQTPNGPKYAGCAGGPHFRDTLYGDTLDVITGHWLHNEAQCCPEAEDHQWILAEGDSLHFLPVRVDTLKK
jgi:hypothetical protein